MDDFFSLAAGFCHGRALFQSFPRKRTKSQPVCLQQQGESGETEVVLKRNRYGHYVAMVKSSGDLSNSCLIQAQRMLLYRRKLANKLALSKGPEKRYITANGTVTAYSTILDSVSIGPIVIDPMSGQALIPVSKATRSCWA